MVHDMLPCSPSGSPAETNLPFRSRSKPSSPLPTQRLPSSPSNSARNSLEDDEGSLWVGSGDEGLLRLRNGKFVSAGEPEGLQGNMSWTIIPRRSGGVWVGSDGGLSRYVDRSVQHIAAPKGQDNIPARTVG